MPLVNLRELRVKLCDRAEFLHHLIRINESLTTDSRDLSEEIAVYERLVDESACELAQAIAQIDQKR